MHFSVLTYRPTAHRRVLLLLGVDHLQIREILLLVRIILVWVVDHLSLPVYALPLGLRVVLLDIFLSVWSAYWVHLIRVVLVSASLPNGVWPILPVLVRPRRLLLWLRLRERFWLLDVALGPFHFSWGVLPDRGLLREIIRWWCYKRGASLIVRQFTLLVSLRRLRRRIHTWVISIGTLSIYSLLRGTVFITFLQNLVLDLFLLFEHFLVEIFIMIVFCKSFLNLLAVKLLHVLQNLLRVLVFPFRISVIFIKVVFFRWEERSFHFLRKKIVPREVSHPHMVFDVFRAVQTKSVEGLSLNEPVYEISSLNGPAVRDVLPFY